MNNATTKAAALTVLRNAKKTVLKIGTDELHVFVGELDDEIEAARKKALKAGNSVEHDGVREWQHTEEIFPEVWHDDGNRTRHEVAHYSKDLETGEITRTVLREIWKRG
jgi:hypothetical protein